MNELAEKALRIVREDPIIAYDTEGSGLDWKINNPIGYVITSQSKDSIYIPIRHGGGGNLPCPEDPRASEPLAAADAPIRIHSFEKALAAAFNERNRRGFLTVTLNGKFDAHFSANAGIMLGRGFADCGIIQALLDEFTKKFSLEALADQYGVTAKKGDELYQFLANKFGGNADRKQMGNFWRTWGQEPLVMEYAAGDGISTMELFEAQIKKIEKEGLQYIYDLERNLTWTLFRMERKGILINQSWCEQLNGVIDTEIKRCEGLLPDKFNSRSPVDMRKYMELLGRMDWPYTDKGNPSFTEHWLKTFPEGKAILDHRRWNNIRNTFLGPLINEHMFKGRVHPTIHQMVGDDFGTISGRLSCSSPNLQQLPKRNKAVARPFRKCFIPDEGMVFYEGDYSQCEPRLFAHYSEEPALVQGYSQTPFRDMHQVVADLLMVERDPTAKRMNMGILTGMYPKAFAEHMQWPLDVARNHWEAWFEAFPMIREFQSKASAVFAQRGYVKTILGRRCRLQHNRFAYRAVSRIIQGGNADIVKYKMLELDKYFENTSDEANLLMTIHDSFEFQMPDGKEANFIKTLLEDVQGPPINLKIPFVVDMGSGSNWSEASFGPEEGK